MSWAISCWTRRTQLMLPELITAFITEFATAWYRAAALASAGNDGDGRWLRSLMWHDRQLTLERKYI